MKEWEEFLESVTRAMSRLLVYISVYSRSLLRFGLDSKWKPLDVLDLVGGSVYVVVVGRRPWLL